MLPEVEEDGAEVLRDELPPELEVAEDPELVEEPEPPPAAALEVFAVPRQLLSLDPMIVAPPDVFD